MPKVKIVIVCDIPDGVPITDINDATDAAVETVQIHLGDDSIISQHFEVCA